MDFKGFMKHVVRLAEAFKLLDAGKALQNDNHGNGGGGSGGNSDGHRGSGRDQGGGRGTGRGRGRGAGRSRGGSISGTENDGDNEQNPLCLWEPHHCQGVRHYLKDCPACPIEEKRALLAKRYENKATREGAASGTRSQTQLNPGTSSLPVTKPTTGWLQQPLNPHTSPTCPIIGSDGPTSHSGLGRSDDGSDESIESPAIEKTAVLKGIGRMSAIAPVNIQVALRDRGQPATFTFSRTWVVPRLVLQLSAGPMALLNVNFLVADNETACKDLLVGLPVLRHLGIDSRTLLEQRWKTLDGTECSGIDDRSITGAAGHLGRLFISRLRSDVRTVEHLHPDRSRSDYYSNRQDLDAFPDPFLLNPEDEGTDGMSARKDIEDMIQRAKDIGFSEEQWTELECLVWEFESAFVTSFSSSAAQVTPLKIRLEPDARPFRVRLRKYSAEQREFMAKMVADLRRHGLVYPKPSARWAAVPLIVPKPGPQQWRLTFDLRPVNSYTQHHQYPMSVLEQELPKLAKSKFYAKFDFIHSYWKMLLDEDSQECQSFITPDRVFSPTRVQHETTNAVMHLQSYLMHTLLQPLLPNLLLWLEDCLIHRPTILHFLDCVRQFLNYCCEFNWKLHPQKCVLFTTTVRWCGRDISPAGICHDPSGLEAMLDMSRPVTEGQLQQFVCALPWLRTSILRFQDLVEQLHILLESVYAHVGKRTKRAVSRVKLDELGWDSSHTIAFNACKDAIAARVRLEHCDETMRLCIYMDTSDTHWSGIVTQVPFSDLSLQRSE